MTSRNRINIILFLIVAVLIAILFFDIGESTQEKFNLSSLNENEITIIEITRNTGEAIKLEKINQQWFMTTPFKVQANTFYVESLLKIAQEKSLSQFSISDIDKTKFKLNPPRATLKLNNQLFLFGTNEQISLKRYILSNNKLFLVTDRYFYILNSVSTGFIDHALVGKKEQIIGLKLANYDLQLKNTKWKIKPERENTSTDDIIQLISEWNNSQAIEIMKLDNVNDYSNFTTIELKLKNKSKTINFDIIKKDDFYMFIRRDLKLQFKLNHDMASRLLEIPNSENSDELEQPE